jgi:dTDP-glucose 4,6-dehydratase
MELLLTGAAGFAGSHALRHVLANTDWTVTCPVSYDHKGKLFRLESAMRWHDPNRVVVVPCDLAMPFPTSVLRQLGTPDYIVNYASDSHVDRSIALPALFIRNNVELMLNMLDFARCQARDSLRAFVQISTDEVYGACQGDPHVEWSPIVPSNPYAASKASQEAIATAYWRTYALPLLIVNCMNMFGEFQDEEKFVQKVISRVNAGQAVTIHASPSGQPGSRCWIHARNLADGILFLLSRVSDGVIPSYRAMTGFEPKPARYNVVGEEIDNLTMAKMIARHLGKELEYKLTDFHNERPGHDIRYALDGRKMAGLGWTPPVSLSESLAKLIDWKTA